MMAYVADFRIMMLLTVVVMPLLFLIRKSSRREAPAAEVADTAH
jgi:hypothetical protein